MNEELINLQYTTIKEPLPDFIYDGLKEYSRDANLYKPQPPALIEALAKKHNIPKEMIFLTAGIDEAIRMYAKAYGTNTYIFTPSYLVYADVKEFGGKLNEINAAQGSDYVIQTDVIKDASLIYLANPNNPAGFTSKDQVIKLIENNSHAKVVLDEAYGDFADLSVLNQVQKYPHLSVFRSFSKSYGMAGNRIGYTVSHPEIISAVRNNAQWANVSYLSVGAALVAMSHEEYFEKMRADINERRDKFSAFLTSQGYSLISSGINAVLIKMPSEDEGEKLFGYLKQNNIIGSHNTNNNSNVGLDGSYVRLAIGSQKQMEVCGKVLTDYAKNQ